NTGISSARLYWENKFGFFNVQGVKIPVGVSVFPDELYQAPRSWTERAYPKLIHYNRLPKGGHFAAWEQPQFFSEEVRAGFRSQRSSERGDDGHTTCPSSSTTAETMDSLADLSTIALTGWSILIRERNTRVSDNSHQRWPSDCRARAWGVC